MASSVVVGDRDEITFEELAFDAAGVVVALVAILGSAEVRARGLAGKLKADGELLKCDPAETLPLAQRYFLF